MDFALWFGDIVFCQHDVAFNCKNSFGIQWLIKEKKKKWRPPVFFVFFAFFRMTKNIQNQCIVGSLPFLCWTYRSASYRRPHAVTKHKMCFLSQDDTVTQWLLLLPQSTKVAGSIPGLRPFFVDFARVPSGFSNSSPQTQHACEGNWELLTINNVFSLRACFWCVCLEIIKPRQEKLQQKLLVKPVVTSPPASPLLGNGQQVAELGLWEREREIENKWVFGFSLIGQLLTTTPSQQL